MPGDGVHRFATAVHIGHGLEQHELPGADVHQEEPAVAGLPCCWPVLVACQQPFGNQEAGVMPGILVTVAGVSQADQQLQATDGQRSGWGGES